MVSFFMTRAFMIHINNETAPDREREQNKGEIHV